MARKTSPFYHLVPKERKENLLFRKKMVEYGLSSREAAEDLWTMCHRDPLFAIGTFFWTYDPRRASAKVVPLIPYPYQEDDTLAILRMIRIGKNGTLKKSRDLGASWFAVSIATWLSVFDNDVAVLFGSRKEEYVDKTGDMKSLFGKVDFQMNHLPSFLRPPKVNRIGGQTRKKLHFENPYTGSTIDGESTNDDFARGDRKTVIFLDEFAAVANGEDIITAAMDTSNCVVAISTTKGTHTYFHKLCSQENWEHIFWHWSMHPEKRIGLYRVAEDGTVDVLDTAWHRENPGYEFITEPGLGSGEFKGLRSVWYDEEWGERPSRVMIAREIDGNDDAAGNQFFDPAEIARMVEDVSLPPLSTGGFTYDPETLEIFGWREYSDGPMRIWVDVDEVKVDKEYVMGVDVAAGTGASNSTIHVIDRSTGATVATYADSNTLPTKLADYVSVVGKQFNNAYCAVEVNGGAGSTCMNRLMEIGYPNLHYRRAEDSRKKKISDKPGWWSSGEMKEALLAEFARAMQSGECLIYDRDTLVECGEFIRDDAGKVVHSQSLSRMEDADRKDLHGDRVIAAALAWHGIRIYGTKVEREEAKPLPRNCAARRRKEYEAALAREGEWGEGARW